MVKPKRNSMVVLVIVDDGTNPVHQSNAHVAPFYIFLICIQAFDGMIDTDMLEMAVH